MGNVCGATASKEELQEIERLKLLNRAIQKELQNTKDQEKHVVKLLLLGTGESGKSTIFKQMRILYDQGFTDIDKTFFKNVLRSNMVEAMQTLVGGLSKWDIELEHEDSEAACDFIEEVEYLNTVFWTPEIVDHVKQLWCNEPGIQEVYKKKSQLQLLDATKYLFSNVDRIGRDDFVPTQKDILMARLRTSGIVERTFEVQNTKFKFLDVGGQRNERKKWLNCFDSVTSVMFVAAISEFDQVLFEQENKNRLQESIEVFTEIVNYDCFEETAMILFLNKIDLFEEKVKSGVKLATFFPDYTGGATVVETRDYIQNMFLDMVGEMHTQMVFCHFTQATDTDHFDKVFDNCKLVILRGNLDKLGLE